MTSLPKRFPDRAEISTARAETEALEPGQDGENELRLAGRVLARREMGKLTFLDLVDRSGRIQLFCEQSVLEGLDLDLGDIVGASGRPMKTRRGEPSLRVGKLEL
jgi:lysyl-tRNA synthetase class 2